MTANIMILTATNFLLPTILQKLRKATFLDYNLQEDKQAPSRIQILKNYINAAQKIGGTLIFQGVDYATLKIVRGESEVWVAVHAGGDGQNYSLTIVEKRAMVQEVTASDILDSLNSKGFIALDIHFDTNKATIREESKPIIDQIVSALRQDQTLKVSIEGHTDNTGTPEDNKTLSLKRAEAVLNALVQTGISASRLSAVGWGEEHSVAENRTEEGRGKESPGLK